MKNTHKLPILTLKDSLFMSFSPSFASQSVLIRVNPCQFLSKSVNFENFFMQNEPKFQKAKIALNPYISNDYVKNCPLLQLKNKAKTKPNKAKSNPILTPPEQKQNQSNPTCSELVEPNKTQFLPSTYLLCLLWQYHFPKEFYRFSFRYIFQSQAYKCCVPSPEFAPSSELFFQTKFGIESFGSSIKLLLMLKWIPNILTFGRLVLTIIFLIMLLLSPSVKNQKLFLDIAFIIFVVAGLTDVADGQIARRLGVASKFGRMVDPLFDKILVCGSFVCFAIIGEPKLFGFSPLVLGIIQWAVAAVLILREVYVTILRHIAEAGGINFAATASGKIKMFLQSFAIGTVVVKIAHFPADEWTYWFTIMVFAIMLIVTVISGLTASGRRHLPA